MSIVTTLLVAAAESEHYGNVQAETFIFGLIAFAVFMLLGLVTFTYRDVANRHSAKGEAYARAHAAELDHGAGHGH